MIDQQNKNAKRTRVFLSYARGDDEAFVKRLHAASSTDLFDHKCGSSGGGRTKPPRRTACVRHEPPGTGSRRRHHLADGHILSLSDDNNQRNLSLRLTLKLQPENTIP